jgi:hypothetical protein
MAVEVWVSLDELSRITALHPVQIRVGLAELVRGGALVHLGDEGIQHVVPPRQAG